MIDEFISEYLNSYMVSFSDDFEGRLRGFKAAILDPAFHPSTELKEMLNKLSAWLNESVTIGVVGQFSSGKSSFLNALLGFDALPTGVVPVTAKPTYIRYAPSAMLGVCYEDGARVMMDVSELGRFVDQRKSLTSVRDLTIYMPCEILKKINFVDTPGLNSQSNADTKETLKILQNVGALIWISLIDNAGRNSELEELKFVPNELKNSSICLLSQRDKLSDEEIKRVLKHTKTTYENSFSKIIPISSKEHKAGLDGGFEEIYAFFDDVTNHLAKDLIFKRCQMIKDEVSGGFGILKGVVDEMEFVLNEGVKEFQDALNLLSQGYKNRLELLYLSIKEIAFEAADEIMKQICVRKKSYFKEKKSIFGAGFEETSYEMSYLNVDGALGALIYQNDLLAKKFKKLKKELEEFAQDLKEGLRKNLEIFERGILIYKGKYQSIRKLSEYHSDVEFAHIRSFASSAKELFYAKFENELVLFEQNLQLFIEEIVIKVATNYENAIKLSISFIDDKIRRSCDDYESDPLAFPLYFPKNTEIGERILVALNYYEFEGKFTGNKSFLQKNIAKLRGEFELILADEIKFLGLMKQKFEENQKLINDLKV